MKNICYLGILILASSIFAVCSAKPAVENKDLPRSDSTITREYSMPAEISETLPVFASDYEVIFCQYVD